MKSNRAWLKKKIEECNESIQLGEEFIFEYEEFRNNVISKIPLSENVRERTVREAVQFSLYEKLNYELLLTINASVLPEKRLSFLINMADKLLPYSLNPDDNKQLERLLSTYSFAELFRLTNSLSVVNRYINELDLHTINIYDRIQIIKPIYERLTWLHEDNLQSLADFKDINPKSFINHSDEPCVDVGILRQLGFSSTKELGYVAYNLRTLLSNINWRILEVVETSYLNNLKVDIMTYFEIDGSVRSASRHVYKRMGNNNFRDIEMVNLELEQGFPLNIIKINYSSGQPIVKEFTIC